MNSMKRNFMLILTSIGLLFTAIFAAYGICATGGGIQDVLPPSWLLWLFILMVFLACAAILKRVIQEGKVCRVIVTTVLMCVFLRILLFGGVVYTFWMKYGDLIFYHYFL